MTPLLSSVTSTKFKVNTKENMKIEAGDLEEL
jgi:hypothetical protein